MFLVIPGEMTNPGAADCKMAQNVVLLRPSLEP
jgi:hypothetical protein